MLIQLHLRSNTDEILGTEAVSYRDDGALSAAMLVGAREIMSHDMISGRLDLTLRLDAENAQGAIVRTLKFENAIAIIRGEPSL